MPGIVLALLAAALDLLAVALGWHAVRAFTKPLPALILAVVAWRANGRGTRVLAGGLVLAAVGDELLLGAAEAAFLLGMLAFAAMQVTYVIAYFRARDIRRSRLKTYQYVVFFAYLFVLASALPRLASNAGAFATPLELYAVLLFLMAVTALRVSPTVAVGGFVFMLSDMTLAYAKFYPGFPLSAYSTELVVMSTYFLAQILITRGMSVTAS